jgi:hypothetical protein
MGDLRGRWVPNATHKPSHLQVTAAAGTSLSSIEQAGQLLFFGQTCTFLDKPMPLAR